MIDMAVNTLRLQADYYQQFGADYALEVPAEGFSGWKTTSLEIAPAHTAVVVMHAWDIPPIEVDPAGYSECEYLPRAEAISHDVLPPLLAAVRASELRLFHVVGQSGYYEHLAGYLRAVALAGPEPKTPPAVEIDAVAEQLWRFRSENVWPGRDNLALRERSTTACDFHSWARPHDNEGIASNAHQLTALCREAGINHLIYTGFTLGGCLLSSPGGMFDMQRCGLMCSVLGEAVTAIENKETARHELMKQIELWRVALLFGFVFHVDDFMKAITSG